MIQASSETGGRFLFIEQFYPGWRATVDGRPTPIERWGGAFQAIQVGPGEHTMIFDYRSRWLLPGAVISVFAMAGLMVLIRSERRKKKVVGAALVRVGDARRVHAAGGALTALAGDAPNLVSCP